MTTKFDPTKPVQTRDGKKARIICTDRKNYAYPIVALIGDDEIVTTYSKHGISNHFNDETQHDLVNIPEEKTLWINIPKNINQTDVIYAYKTKKEADHYASSRNAGRIFCVKIICKDGDGLE